MRNSLDLDIRINALLKTHQVNANATISEESRQESDACLKEVASLSEKVQSMEGLPGFERRRVGDVSFEVLFCFTQRSTFLLLFGVISR